MFLIKHKLPVLTYYERKYIISMTERPSDELKYNFKTILKHFNLLFYYRIKYNL